MGTAYCKMVEYPIDAAAAAKDVYISPTPELLSRFNTMNGLGSRDMLYPGQLLVVPSSTMNEQEAGGLRTLPQIVNHQGRNGGTPADSKAYNREFDLFQALTTYAGGALASPYFGGVTDYIQIRLGEVEKQFGLLQDAYLKAQRANLRLGSPQAQALRSAPEAALKAQLTGLAKTKLLVRPDAKSLKDALDISHKSIAHQVRTTGSPVEVREISRAIGKTKALSTVVKRAGMIGLTISVGSSIATTIDDYKTKGSKAGISTGYRETSGFAGALGGAVLLGFVVGTGGLGLGIVAVGLAAVAGGVAGEFAGRTIWDGAGQDSGLIEMTEPAVDWIIKVAN